eukprot:GHVU01143351.1.p1 GENE.GHVU01143351.1~~GHVU01143351.1.p1  ORF type:complete len:255 (-),score=29.97 GHVU01143351.1:1620-2384(-)
MQADADRITREQEEGEKESDAVTTNSAREHIFASVTDQGSNMLAAFKNLYGTNCIAHGIHNEVKNLIKRWELKFAVKKAKIFIKHIQKSKAARDNFKTKQKHAKIVKPTKPQKTVETRWTSYNDLLLWFTHNKTAIHYYLCSPTYTSAGKRKTIEEILPNMSPTVSEWDVLATLNIILKPLATITVALQSSTKPTRHLLLPLLAQTLKKLEDIKASEATLTSGLVGAVEALQSGILERFKFNQGELQLSSPYNE